MTVDPELVGVGPHSVAAGEADSASGRVSAALEDRVLRDRRLALLVAVITDYEYEFGEITDEEIVRQRRADRERPRVVRGRRAPASAISQTASR